MTTTTITSARTATATPAYADRPTVWRHGVAATATAALVVTALAAGAHAAGVSFEDRTGAGIPLLGFTQLTVVFSLVGVALAAVLARRARTPRRTFVRTALALLALSFVPDLAVGFDAGSAATLMALHTVAAAIVVPTLAARLAGVRR